MTFEQMVAGLAFANKMVDSFDAPWAWGLPRKPISRRKRIDDEFALEYCNLLPYDYRDSTMQLAELGVVRRTKNGFVSKAVQVLYGCKADWSDDYTGDPILLVVYMKYPELSTRFPYAGQSGGWSQWTEFDISDPSSMAAVSTLINSIPFARCEWSEDPGELYEKLSEHMFVRGIKTLEKGAVV